MRIAVGMMHAVDPCFAHLALNLPDPHGGHTPLWALVTASVRIGPTRGYGFSTSPPDILKLFPLGLVSPERGSPVRSAAASSAAGWRRRAGHLYATKGTNV